MRRSFRESRLRAGFTTQQALAERMDVSPDTINKIESGKRSPSLKLFVRLKSVLGDEIEGFLVNDVRAS